MRRLRAELEKAQAARQLAEQERIEAEEREQQADQGFQLTGADLARFREERQLGQRAAGRLLGVSHGTISKAEQAPTRALGPMLQPALAAALRE